MAINNYPKTSNNGYRHHHDTIVSSLATMSPALKSNHSKQVTDKTNAYILTSNFIRDNSNWSIDSLYNYCMQYYKEFGLTPILFSECVREYIEAKSKL